MPSFRAGHSGLRRFSRETTSGLSGRGIPPAGTTGSDPRAPAIPGAGSPRDAEKPAVVLSNTYADLQDFYGSDRTRTRDLRLTGRSWRLRAERGSAGIPA